MLKCSLIGAALVTAALAQTAPSSVDFANLREDVRGLTQRVGELTLKVEQLERENSELRQKLGALNGTYATDQQLQGAILEVNRAIKVAVAEGKKDALGEVDAKIDKLAAATNHALESMAKAQATRGVPASSATFTENYPKEGVSYSVQKGDTLAIIAKKTGAKQQDIINANKLADPSKVMVGQTLFIPGGK